MNPGHVAIVLAAGGSRRLGQPKQLLTREGETLVRRAVRLAAATAPSQVVLVCGAHAAEVRNAAGDARATVLVNLDWQQGLSGSLRVVADHLRGSGR
ncbi:MAG: NTP transferase domain-containing protein, partial [Pseudoxanthomonas sp.]